MDIISFNEASTANGRIESFIENPDSTSGIVTVPKVIASGETITIPAGRVAVLPNVQVDGVINIEGEVFVPSGSSYTGTDIESNNAVFDTLKVQGQNVSPFSGFKNYIINGNFDIWQRGVSQTISGYGSVDRWNFINAGTSSRTISKVIATDTDRPYFNSPNILGITLTSLDATTSPRAIRHNQAIEDVTQLAGKTITLSFWAMATNNTNIETTIQQVFGTGGSPSSAVITGAKRFSLTPQWTKFTTTVNVPSIVGKTLGTDGIHTSTTNVKFHLMSDSVDASNEGLTGTLTPTAGTIVFFAQVQLEEGSVATPFENRPYGLELSLCQRYYEVLGCGIGQVKDASSIVLHFSSSEKRVPATAILLNTSPYAESPISLIARNGVSSTLATQMNQLTSKSSGHIILITGFSSMTAGQSASINAGVIALSAEL